MPDKTKTTSAKPISSETEEKEKKFYNKELEIEEMNEITQKNCGKKDKCKKKRKFTHFLHSKYKVDTDFSKVSFPKCQEHWLEFPRSG